MGELAGKNYKLQIENPGGGGTYEDVAGLQSHDDAFEAGNIDVTNYGSGGWAKKLDGAGTRSIKVSGQGVADDGAHMTLIRNAWKDRASINLRLLQVDSAGSTVRSVTGAWKIPSFNETGKFDEAHTFSISLESNGEMTFA